MKPQSGPTLRDTSREHLALKTQGQKRQREDLLPSSRVGSHICNLLWTSRSRATIFHIPHDIWKIILGKQEWATLCNVSRTCLFLYEDANFLMVSIARRTLPGLRLDLADKDVRHAYLILQGKASFANISWSGSSDTIKARLKDTLVLPDSVIKRLPSRKIGAYIFYETPMVFAAVLNHHVSFAVLNKKLRDVERKRREKEEAKEAIKKEAERLKQEAIEIEKKIQEEKRRLYELKCQKKKEERDRRTSLMETALSGMGFRGWSDVWPSIQGFEHEIGNLTWLWMLNHRQDHPSVVEDFVSMLRVLCQGLLERGSWYSLERIVTPEGLYYRLFTATRVLTEQGRYIFVFNQKMELFAVRQVCKKSFYVECDSDIVSDEMIRERARTLMKLE